MRGIAYGLLTLAVRPVLTFVAFLVGYLVLALLLGARGPGVGASVSVVGAIVFAWFVYMWLGYRHGS